MLLPEGDFVVEVVLSGVGVKEFGVANDADLMMSETMTWVISDLLGLGGGCPVHRWLLAITLEHAALETTWLGDNDGMFNWPFGGAPVLSGCGTAQF